MQRVRIEIEDGIVTFLDIGEGVKLELVDIDSEYVGDPDHDPDGEPGVIEKHYIRGDDGAEKCIYRDERNQV